MHTTARTGIEVGAVVSISTVHWALQPALLFSQKGFNTDDEYTDKYTVPGAPLPSSQTYRTKAEYSFNYLTLPLNVVYTQRANGRGFRLFAGPYLSLLLGGHFTSKDSNSYRVPGASGGNSYLTTGRVAAYVDPRPFNPNRDVFYTQRFDVGVQGGLGYGYGRVLLHIGYSLGLRNLGKEQVMSGNTVTISASVYHNSAFQASVAYLLFPKQ